MMYRSCSSIENFWLNFNGRIDKGKPLTLCCENNKDMPRTALCETAQETIDNFTKERNKLVVESVKYGLLGGKEDERKFTAGCAKCPYFLEGNNGNFDGLIHYINLSMYPAPCQCKCIYCNVHCGEDGVFNKELHACYYEKVFDTLEYARDKGLIAPDAVWQVSSGEITIHPYKDRIIDLVKNQTAVFYSNCFIFDKDVAANLAENPRSSINLSIDAGTPQTWAKVKGVDNFAKVTENLARYFASSSRPGQITLKYIVLPGINNNIEDYLYVVKIMKILKVSHLTIARDTSVKYSLNEQETNALLGSAGYLAAILHKNGMTMDMFLYTPEERNRIVGFANHLLQTEKV